jgi:hypothetical protein
MRTDVKLVSRDGKTFTKVRRLIATALVASGRARLLDPLNHARGIVMAQKVTVESDIQDRPESGQERALHTAAIYGKRPFFGGGLTRTENKPFVFFKEKYIP